MSPPAPDHPLPTLGELPHDPRFIERIAQATPDIIFVYDLIEKRHVFLNRRAEIVLGYSMEEIRALQDPAALLIHPDDRAARHAYLEGFSAAPDGETREYEHRFRAADGSYRWILTRGSVFARTADGRAKQIAGVAVDITERKRAEEKLRLTQETFFSLIHNSPFGVYVIDAQFRLIEVSKGAQNVFAQVRPLLGRDFAEVLRIVWPEPFASEAIALFRRTLATGEPYHAPDTTETRADIGEVESYDWRLEQLRLPDGQLGVVCYFYDMSARRRAELALRESEARFRNMADNAPVMVWVTDPDGRCIYLNRVWYDFTGQATEEALGAGWLDAVHPDDRAAANEAFFSANLKQAGFRVEYRLRHRDGTYRWAIDAAAPRFGAQGEFLGYVGSVIDIQDRRETEEALRKSYERFDIVKDASQVGFWFCDLPFDTLEWDARVKEHFWVAPEARVTIDTFYAHLHPEDRERTRASIAKSIAEKTRYDIEYRTQPPGGSEVKWIRAIGRTFYDAEERPIRFDGVTLDITEIKRSETALRAAKESAEQASRAKDEFLAQLSHELRTPLSPVLLLASEGAEDRSLPAAVRADFKMIADNVALEARLIDDLLDLNRITRGKVSLDREPLDLHRVIQDATVTVQSDFTTKRLTTTYALRATRPELLGDPVRLRQVIWNLLKNAVKFTPAGGSVEISTADFGEDRIEVRIRDTGLGMKPDELTRVFEPFVQGNHVSRHGEDSLGGLGLGLAISRALVTAHGGQIRAESPGPGLGTTLIILLPRGDADRAPAKSHRSN